MRVAERYARVVERFRREMPEAATELNFENPYQLLVAVILSAQCTDKRVNLITPALFEAFPTAYDLANATAEEVFELIKSCSYPNNKTRSLLGMARKLVDDFGGQVPDSHEALMSLPGVGRKTANVVLSVIYGQPTMAVDTHVFRVAERLGLTTKSKNPLTTEKTLTENIDVADIPLAHHWLILHGRYVCKARNPQCEGCFLRDVCRAYPRFRREAEKREALKKALKPASDK